MVVVVLLLVLMEADMTDQCGRGCQHVTCMNRTIPTILWQYPFPMALGHKHIARHMFGKLQTYNLCSGIVWRLDNGGYSK